MTTEIRTAQDAAALREKLAEYDKREGNGDRWGRRREESGSGPIQGLLVPIKVELGEGCSIRCQLILPPECAASEDALLDALRALRDKGAPIDVYEKREGWDGRGGGGRYRDDDRRGRGRGWGRGGRW